MSTTRRSGLFVACRHVVPRRTSESHRTQSGSVLLLVLGVVLMLSVAVIALLNLSLNTGNVAVKLETSTRTVHDIDGALEDAVNDVRVDQTACDGATDVHSGYDVSCDELTPSAAPASGEPAVRTMRLTAYNPGTSDVVGRAQVQVTDGVPGRVIIGNTIEVCDWLLGQNVSQQMRGCSA